MSLRNEKTPVYTYRSTGLVDEWTVARGALGKSGGRWLPVRQPAVYAGDVFRTLARSQGIVLRQARLANRKPQGMTELGRVQSGELRKIVRDMLKWSTNVTAEMVGMAATVARGGKPSGLEGSGRAMSAWAKARFGMTTARLVDHSGLGGSSRMSAAELVQALVQVRERNLLRPILKPIPVRDEKGNVVKNTPVKVDAKTGTLNFVSGLGGFLTAADGRELAFAFFSVDPDMRAGIARQNRERPQGARPWNRRSRQLQYNLLRRWGAMFGS